MPEEPTFFIGNVPITGDLILAPMDGISDSPFRGICRQLGSAMSVTEFINALDVIEENPRYKHRLAYEDFHRPLAMQILGNQPERMLTAILRLLPEVKPDILDINLGCQSRNVTARGAGAALLKSPAKIAAIFHLMTQHLDIPVTGKIRLGWDENQRNYLEVAHAIQDSGGAMVTVHGRTRKQGFRGGADWEAIREIKQALQIPVIANGDVKTVADITRIKTQTGCDAVMIGRAALGNPWIFNRMDRQDVPTSMVVKTILKHLENVRDFYGNQGVLPFRKHLKAYLLPWDLPREVLLSLLKTNDIDWLLGDLKKLFSERKLG